MLIWASVLKRTCKTILWWNVQIQIMDTSLSFSGSGSVLRKNIFVQFSGLFPEPVPTPSINQAVRGITDVNYSICVSPCQKSLRSQSQVRSDRTGNLLFLVMKSSLSWCWRWEWQSTHSKCSRLHILSLSRIYTEQKYKCNNCEDYIDLQLI